MVRALSGVGYDESPMKVVMVRADPDLDVEMSERPTAFRHYYLGASHFRSVAGILKLACSWICLKIPASDVTSIESLMKAPYSPLQNIWSFEPDNVFKMDPGEEMHPAVRPKRQTRPPTRLLDYVVDPMGYQPRDPSQWRPPPLSPLFCGSFTGDAAHPETPQLAPSHFQSTLLTPPPEHPYQPVPYQDSSLPMEIRAIREESAKLYQSQQWIQSGLKELKEAHAEMKELIQVARSLKMEIASSPGSQSPVKPPHAVVAAPSAAFHPGVEPDMVWPDPPPWPELEGDLQGDMQHLKIERDSNQPYYPPKVPVHDPLWPPPPPPHPFPSASYGDQRHSSPALTQRCPPAFTIPPPRQAPTYRTPPPVSEQLYRGPQPTIPKFTNPDPSEFNRLRIALENLLPANTSELFRYQILVDHLRLEDAGSQLPLSF